jgi:hypothetical protein
MYTSVTFRWHIGALPIVLGFDGKYAIMRMFNQTKTVSRTAPWDEYGFPFCLSNHMIAIGDEYV